MYEGFLVGVVMLDETESFFRIEKFYGAVFFVHCCLFCIDKECEGTEIQAGNGSFF